jgi:hypothetical protein
VPELCRTAEPIEPVPGLFVPVATVGHLLALKLLSSAPSRPQDAIDIQSLLGGLTPAERERCESAVRQIEAAGANRGKAVTDELRGLLSNRRP